MKAMNKTLLGSECLGIVLAGGLSTRMGENKANLQHFAVKANLPNNPSCNQQSNMLEFSQQTLKNSGINNVVVSGDNYEVTDNYKNLGPIAGIYSVIQQYRPKAVLVMPVDLPLMTCDILQNLKLKGELSQKACFYDNHYLPLYLPVNSLTELTFSQLFSHMNNNINGSATIKNNSTRHEIKGPSMRQFLSQLPHQRLVLKNEKSLFNCNTPQQWQQAQALHNKTVVN